MTASPRSSTASLARARVFHCHSPPLKQVLRADIVSLVNCIARHVHTCACENYGAPNKNIGDAFLLVWKPKGDVRCSVSLSRARSLACEVARRCCEVVLRIPSPLPPSERSLLHARMSDACKTRVVEDTHVLSLSPSLARAHTQRIQGGDTLPLSRPVHFPHTYALTNSHSLVCARSLSPFLPSSLPY